MQSERASTSVIKIRCLPILFDLCALLAIGMSLRITTTSGLYHGALRWGSGNAKKVIAWHGWLDNAATYNYLGPVLAEQGYDVIACDHLGHGRSSHLPHGASYTYASGVSSMKRVLDSLSQEDDGWAKPFAHIGHSMSAGQSVLFAASFPDMVERLVLLEGLGPMVAKEGDGPIKMRNAVINEEHWLARQTPFADMSMPKIYENVQRAIDARISAVSRHPGDQSISREAASAIVCRGTFDESEDAASKVTWVSGQPLLRVARGRGHGDEADTLDSDPFPVRFRHDSRMSLPSHVYMTEEQVRGFVRCIAAPTLLVTAEKGWPFSESVRERIDIMEAQGNLKEHHVLPGYHHCHLDPDTAGKTAEVVSAFLNAY